VIEGLEESNQMLGLRGCWLGVVRPEIYRMQVRVIAEAVHAVREEVHTPVVEIMITCSASGKSSGDS
jgi:pyruvate,orthophosphate dikinase